MFTFLFASVAQANAAEPGSPISSADCSNLVALIKKKSILRNSIHSIFYHQSFVESWIESTLVVNLPLPEVKCKEQRMMLTSRERK